MSRYAENTSVPIDRSRTEIERILTRYGADAFMYGWDSEGDIPQAVVMFRMRQKQIKFLVPMPDSSSDDVCYSPAGRERTDQQKDAIMSQMSRQKWRALSLVIKAKLEAVDSGISMFEEEFLAHIVLPDGKTIGEFMIPQIETIYSSGKMPKLLPIGKGGGST